MSINRKVAACWCCATRINKPYEQSLHWRQHVQNHDSRDLRQRDDTFAYAVSSLRLFRFEHQSFFLIFIVQQLLLSKWNRDVCQSAIMSAYFRFFLCNNMFYLLKNSTKFAKIKDYTFLVQFWRLWRVF